MNLIPIADMLEAAGTGTQGTSLFVGEMPADCDQGVLLLNGYYGTPIDPYLKHYRRTSFRIIVRSPGDSYDQGEELAWACIDAATIHVERQLGPLLIKQMLPQNEPRPYRRSAGNYWEFEVDVDVNFVGTR